MEQTLTGAMFSVTLTAALVGLQALQFGPALYLEQKGIDIGMWLYANVGWVEANPHAGSDQQHGYAFLDVDQAACEAFLDDAPRTACTTENPVQAALILDAVRALRASDAAVIIIDAAPPNAAQVRERNALRTGLASEDGAWVIAPLYARPADDGSMPFRVEANGFIRHRLG